MNKALFGRYWPARSPVHSLDPRIKITLVFAMIAIVFLADNWAAIGFCSACVLAFFAVAKISPLEAIRSIAPLLFIVALTAIFNIFYIGTGSVLVDFGWLRITTDGVASAAFLSVRLVLLLLMGSLLTMTTTTFDITFGIEGMLVPLTKIGVPVHEFAFVVSTALGFLPQIAEEFESIRIAQEARGAKLATTPLKGARALSSLITPMFASVFRHADTLALAMDARCYVPGARRSRLHPFELHARDFVAVTIVAIICALVALLRFL